LLQNVVIQKGDARRSVQGYMVLALAQHHAGFLASAVASLEAGLELSKRSLHEPSRSTPDEVWNDWIIAQSLIREATTLIPVPNVPASKR